MIWPFVVVAGALAAPHARELWRNPADPRARSAAPGRFAKLPMGRTHYRLIGPQDGPLIVAVHGLTTPGFVWDTLSQMLARDGCRVLSYDLYGRGFSDRVAGRQDQAFFLRQLDELLDHLGLQGSLTLMGYSMGGSVATCFAARNPARVSKLVLLAPTGMRQLDAPLPGQILDMPVIGDRAMLALYPGMLHRGILAEAAGANAVPHIHAAQRVELTRRGFIPAITASFRGILRKALQAEHSRLHAAKVPVLALWGETDRVIAPAAAQTLAEWNPDARNFVVTGAGHGLAYSHPAQILERVRPFLRGTGT